MTTTTENQTAKPNAELHLRRNTLNGRSGAEAYQLITGARGTGFGD